MPRRRIIKCLEPYEVQPDGCWRWTGPLGWQNYGPYRRYYEAAYGPVPEGLTLDHVCHSRDEACTGGLGCVHRACVNPDHLEPVTHAENVLRGRGPTAANARKTTCPQGHPYEGRNVHIERDGSRRCRTCNAEHQRRWRERRRAAQQS